MPYDGEERRQQPVDIQPSSVSERFMLALHEQNLAINKANLEVTREQDRKIDIVIENQATTRAILLRVVGDDGTGGQIQDHEERISTLEHHQTSAEQRRLDQVKVVGVVSAVASFLGALASMTWLHKLYHRVIDVIGR